jgi:integrase
MKESQKVKLWAIRPRPGRPSPFEVRWIVDGHEFSRSYATKGLAENYLLDLRKAMKAGETFATVKPGEPLSWARSEATLYDLVRDYVALRWEDGSAANTRQAVVDGLIPAVLSFLHGSRKAGKGRPADRVLRMALRHWGLRPPVWDQEPPAEMAEALAWIKGASRPIVELGEPDAIRAVLAGMSLRLDGKPLGRSSIKTRRSVLHGALEYITLERRCLTANPLAGIRIRRARTVDRVDPRKVPNRAQARALLGALATARLPRDQHLHAFFAVLYYAGTRPGEARGLRRADLTLPAQGWGKITLGQSIPESLGGWTDSGQRFESRELKHRAPGTVRPVPIPAELVTILRNHLDRYGTAPDGRLFWDGPAHEPIKGHVYIAAWGRARKAALTAEEQGTTLAKRPYDLRHGNASYLLSVGVSSAEVARRLGHSVAMLHTTYAHWLEGQEDSANKLIDAAAKADDALTSTNTNHGPGAGQQDKKAAA